MIKKTNKDDTVNEEYDDSKTGGESSYDSQYQTGDDDTYQDSTVQESDEEQPKAKNAKTKNIILFTIFGIALAGVLYKVAPIMFGFGGNQEQVQPQALAPTPQPVVPTPQPTAPTPPVPVEPPVQPVTPTEPVPVPQQTPAAVSPVQQDSGVPNLGGESSAQVPTNTAEQPPALGEQTHEIPKPSLGNESVPVLSNNTPPKATTVVDNETKESIDRLIDRVGAMDDSVQNMNETMNSVKDTVKTHTEEISALDVRVTKLENDMKIQQDKMTAIEEAKKEAVKPAVKPVVKKKSTVKRAATSSSRNSVHIVDSDTPRKAVRSSSSTSSGKAVSRNSSYGYTIQAVLPGRAWVKNPNGTTSTYSIGDTLPTGNKVGKIDPDGGVFDSTGKRWPN